MDPGPVQSLILETIKRKTMKKALITFVKAPVPGTVKTRLQADVGPEKAVTTYKAFVTEIVSKCTRLKDVDRYLGCAPSAGHAFLRDMAETYNLKTFSQRGNTLGDRIFNAFKYCARKGYSEIVLIGSDSPSIPMNIIRKAFTELKKNDLVIGPCFDLGLYLIGVRKELIPELARNIKIDTGNDVNVILRDMSQMNIRLHMLPFWYDVDNIEDLNFLRSHLNYLNNNLSI
jgi:rSAM/selenodomain-associated transferase 1